jgi:hypothetical protein
MDIATQEWRFSGRPIYNWPELPDGPKVRNPVIEIPSDGGTSDFQAQFEREAFFDRDDADAAKITKRLDPLPPSGRLTDEPGAELQSIVWDQPSATIFRHRFVMRSRYAAAMTEGATAEVQTWPGAPDPVGAPDPFATWTKRVVFRANVGRVELNRPQIRALLPLTMAPDDSAAEGPPILCVLEEKPFVQGGLADRVLGLIKTGIQFGFPEDGVAPGDDAWVVQPKDTRKEVGPDPRLSLMPLPADEALAMTLAHEGPIGLTFDSGAITTPAWSNSQHLLSPIVIGDHDGRIEDELYLGVSLLRMLDPAWCDTPKLETAENLPANRSWIVRFDGGPDLTVGGKQILQTVPREGRSHVQVWNRSLDDKPKDEDWLDLCEVAPSKTEPVSLLHQALGEGRFRATILAAAPQLQATKRIETGQNNTPRVMASVDWSLPKKLAEALTSGPTLGVPEGSDVYEAAASAPTEVQWVASARNSQTLHHAERETHRTTKPRAIGDLRVRINDDTLRFTNQGGQDLWLRGKLGPPNVPVAIHRHLAVVLTKNAPGLGRPLEVYFDTARLDAAAVSLPAGTGESAALGELNLRVVEYETPARPICVNSEQLAGLPPIYAETYFDLVATGGSHLDKENTEPPNALSFTIRLIRSAPANKPLRSVEITLRSAGGSENAPILLTLDESAADAIFVDTILLSLMEDAGAYAITCRKIMTDGTEAEAESPEVTISTDLDPGLFLAMAATGADGGTPDLWADVSLLHSEGATAGFDLDWVFSKAKQGETPDQATRAEALRNMIEVQARIVSVSPSVPVDGTPS